MGQLVQQLMQQNQALIDQNANMNVRFGQLEQRLQAAEFAATKGGGGKGAGKGERTGAARRGALARLGVSCAPTEARADKKVGKCAQLKQLDVMIAKQIPQDAGTSCQAQEDAPKTSGTRWS